MRTVSTTANVDHVAAAILVKGGDGKLHLDHHDTTAADLEWGGALVGGALAVVAAPLAIAPLSVAATRNTTWAGAGGIVGYFWHNIPKGQLLRMSDLAESGQAALVVVVLDHTATDIEALLRQRHRGDRRRNRWRRHRARLRGGDGAASNGRPDHGAAWPAGPAERRQMTLDHQRQRAAGHDAHHVRRQHLERAATTLGVAEPDGASDVRRGRDRRHRDGDSDRRARPRSRRRASPPCQRRGRRERRPVRPRSATARARCRPAPGHRRSARRRAAVAVVAAAVRAATPRPMHSVKVARPASAHRRSTSPTAVAEMGSKSGLSAIAPTTRIDEPSSTPTPATTPAAAMKRRYSSAVRACSAARPVTSAHTAESRPRCAVRRRLQPSGSMLDVRQRTKSSASRSRSAQQLEHVIGDVDVELTGDLGEVPRGATADDDMPHAGHGSELLLDRLGSLRRYVGAELEHGFGVSRRPRQGAGSSGRGCTAA